MKRILNVSSHSFTEDQQKELREKYYEVVELSEDLKKKWGSINIGSLLEVVDSICDFAKENNIHVAFVAGQLAANGLLVDLLRNYNIKSVFAFTDRVSEEVRQEDGSVKKVSVFKHRGFFYYPDRESKKVEELKTGLYIVIDMDEENMYLHLEWRKASTRECNIDLINGKYVLDMMCFGEWYPNASFDTVDGIMNNLIDEWGLHPEMVDEVRSNIEKLVNQKVDDYAKAN